MTRLAFNSEHKDLSASDRIKGMHYLKPTMCLIFFFKEWG